jgi:hypothetical protein
MAFWTLLSAVVVTTLAIVIGNLAPAVLSHNGCDAFGYLAFGLIAMAYTVPLAVGAMQAARTAFLPPLVPKQA